MPRAAKARCTAYAATRVFPEPVAAVFTPSSDPFSMFALAIPLVVFYFLSIGIGKLLGR